MKLLVSGTRAHTRRAYMKEEKQDPFASIMKFCKPTASQEAKFQKCPLLRESEDFADSNLDRVSSSPEPTPSKPTGIIILSPPDSQREDDLVYHTPPEEQNLDESSSDGARTVNLADGFDGKKRVRCFEEEVNDEFISKENTICETVTIGETEPIMIGIDGNGNLEINTEDKDLMSTESVNVEKIDEGGVVRGDKEEEEGIIGETELVSEKLIHELDAGNEQDGLMKESDNMENVTVDTGGRPCKKVNFYGSLDSGKAVGNGCVEMREDSGVGGDEEFANDTEEDENTSKDRCEDGLRSGRKNIEDIDKFRYVGGGEVRRGKKRRDDAVGGVGSRRKLPLSLKGKERNVGDRDVAANSAGTVTRFLNGCLNVLKLIGGDVDNSCKDVDFLEIAKRRGLKFPRPRWWPHEGDEK